MKHRIVVGKAAAGDIADAHAWYTGQRAGLGREFLDEIEATLNRIADGPQRFPVALSDVCRALVRRFPYSVYFRIRGTDVRIIAVIHQHRDPREWQRRV